MTIDKTRHRTQKWYASEDEESEIDAHCKANGLKKSEFTRSVVLRDVRAAKAQPPAHRKRRGGSREGPKLGPRLPHTFAKRPGGAPTPLRI